MAGAGRDYMTIGEVVESLAGAFPNLSVSKVRFLEEEGLISPARTPGGYRKFTEADLSRIELILRLQRERFLPLAVIRQKLKDLDRGKVPEELRSATPMAEAVSLPLEDDGGVSMARAPVELGMPEEFLRGLVEYGLLQPKDRGDGEEIDRLDIEIAHACWQLRRYGVEPRHLRMFGGFGEREARLFLQVLMPAMRHRTPEARQKVVERLGDLTDVTEELKRLLLRRALAALFEDVT